MCHDYEQHIRWAQYCAVMQAAELGIPTQQSEVDLPLADDIKINDMGPVMRAAGNVIELVPMNFSFPPSGRGGPVFNFRSEGRHFDKSNRCLGVGIFRVHRQKAPQGKASLHPQWRAVPCRRGHLARGKGHCPASLHDADNIARTGRRALPFPANRRAAPGGLGSVDLSD
jgi:hypothetical protein